MRNWLRALLAAEDGATAIEYGLILALVAIAAMLSFMNLGSANQGQWNHVSSNVENSVN